MNTFTYQIGNNLYINLTNRCSNRCTFCVRDQSAEYEGYSLWLDNEPTAEQVTAEIGDPKKYDEIVFCGYGEPTCAYDTLLRTAEYLKKKGLRLRLNTNGLSDLINGKPTAEAICKNIDTISVSLNAPTAEKYEKLCHPAFGEKAFDAMLAFARQCKELGANVKFTVVDVIPPEDIEACKALAKSMDIPLRVRAYIAE